MHDYYIQQSKGTDLGAYTHLIDAVPDSIGDIAKIVSNLIYHYMSDKPVYGWDIPVERLGEIDTRHVSAMLATLMALDSRPLVEVRVPEQRLMGCCRDFTALFVAIVRHKGIPARARYGFATYFEEGYYNDHVVAEIWDGTRWQMVDPELNQKRIEVFEITDLDPLNLSAGAFLNGAEAWHLAKHSDIDTSRFCVASTIDNPAIRGTHFIVDHLVQDIAALNKVEALCWDWWGFNLYDESTGEFLEPNAVQSTQLDRAADIVLSGDLERIQALFNEAPFKPGQVWSYSPAIPDEQKPIEVTLC